MESDEIWSQNMMCALKIKLKLQAECVVSSQESRVLRIRRNSVLKEWRSVVKHSVISDAWVKVKWMKGEESSIVCIKVTVNGKR